MNMVVQMFDNMRTNRASVWEEVEKISNFETNRQNTNNKLYDDSLKSIDHDQLASKPSQSRAEITSLPNEILNLILAYLDLKTMFILRSTCKTFYQLCSDKILFKKLDLQPYWSTVDKI
jgi:hypothetical protein